jgi:hypothetical protein
MNTISNIWNHPKTSAAGLLIAIVAIAGALSQQGISLGNAGSGSVVSLVAALATALLGLLAKDPDSVQQTSGQASRQASGVAAKLGAWLLIALLIPLPWMEGCTAVTAAQDIVNWTPALQSAVAIVDSTAAVLAPADASIFTSATTAFDADSNLLVNQAKAYLANPSASILAEMQTQIVTLNQQVNAALLQANKITDAAGQQHAMAAIEDVATVATAIMSLVESISSKAAVAQMAAQSAVKISAVAPYFNRPRAATIVAAHYGESIGQAEVQIDRVEQSEIAAGL